METPGFDRLAREGVLAEIAIAPAPETAPSHATLFTGATSGAELLDVARGYHAEVLYADRQRARMDAALRAKGGAERTLAVTSDHGEGLGQHRWLEHSVHLYDEQLRVPLLFHWPGTLPAGGRVLTPVGLVDVAPALASLSGVDFPGAGAGRSPAQRPTPAPLDPETRRGLEALGYAE